MFKFSKAELLLGVIDKRLFRWDHLPALARLRFVQKSYVLLLVLPLLDQFFSPILNLPAGTKLVVDIGWIYVLPRDLTIAFELEMPFSWKLIYYLVLFLGCGSAINEIFAPRLIGVSWPKAATRHLVLQNFREVANGIASARRANHFMYDLLARHATNIEELLHIPQEAVQRAALKGEKLISLQTGESSFRVNRYSVYYIAEHMEIKEEDFAVALEEIAWFSNETRLVARWLSGSCVLVSIALFVILIFQGMIRMLS